MQFYCKSQNPALIVLRVSRLRYKKSHEATSPLFYQLNLFLAVVGKKRFDAREVFLPVGLLVTL